MASHQLTGKLFKRRTMTYLVFVEGGDTPKVHHYSQAKANTEGARLYEKLKRPVYICKIVNAYPTTKKDERGSCE